MKEETSMGSQGFGGFNKKQLEKLKALLDQMNTVTTISNYVQHGDISQGLIPFSDSYSDPWIIDSRASNHMTGGENIAGRSVLPLLVWSHAATKHGDVEKADNIQPAATTEADEAKATNARTIPNLSYTQPVINSRISYHQSYGDHTLFIKQLPKMKIIALIVYVDDIIVIRDDIEVMQNLKGKMLGCKLMGTSIDQNHELGVIIEGIPIDKGRYQ
ncbi:hypothetical protein CK203_084430 [Vitis vinifera]|uniref:Reverse transcriptase Ty1/copia-type domain-containing protein n=1 Tax=Vitis vinifera TaxID=29760 RepID=A0A438EN33_VITVI|nr:hypothetical protein CK203_084430 [Vitis vinifera]